MVKVGEGWKRTETKDEDQGGINCCLVYAKEKNVTNGKKGAKGHRVHQEVLLSTSLISAEKKERRRKY